GIALVLLCGIVLYYFSRMKLSLAPLTITVDFFQVLGRQASIAIPWGSGTSAALRWSALLDFDLELMAPECVINVDFTTTWLAVNVMPLAGIVVLAVFHFGRGRRGNRTGWLDLSEARIRTFLSSVMLLCQLVYMVLVVKALAALDCVSIPGGRQVLESSSSIVCWESKEHMPLMIGGAVAVLVYAIGIPLAFMWAMQRARDPHRSQSSRAFWVAVTAPLSARFRPSHTSWILVIMVRKALIAAGVILQSTRPIMQLTLSIFVLAVALALQMRHRPYDTMSKVLVEECGHARLKGIVARARRRVRSQGQTRAPSTGDQISPTQGTAQAAAPSAWKQDTFVGVAARMADANVMEESSLLASIMVVAAGQMFLAADVSAQQNLGLPDWSLALLDAGVVCVTAGSGLYITIITIVAAWIVNHQR
ncbi:MAG: hypothetical protein Q8N51_08415, partial [Gammaproteobacteria bacterium]|nr:hypothetical protein [Gammaproteobacteria bacterium]